MEKELQKLERIQEVDTPPFLFTRIQEKVKKQLADRVSGKQAVLYLAGIALVVLVNVFALRSTGSHAPEKTLVTELGLSSINQLYP